MRDLKYYAAIIVITALIGVFMANVEGVGVILPSWFPLVFIVGLLLLALIVTMATLVVLLNVGRILRRISKEDKFDSQE